MATETTPPVVPPAGETAAAVPEAKHEGLPALMHNLLSDVPDDQKPLVKEKTPEEKAAEKTEADRLAAIEAEKTKKVDKPITARREKVKRPELPITPARREAEPEPRPAARQAKPDDDADLEPEEKQMIEDAIEAEKLLGDRKAGLTDKARKFVRANIEFIKKAGDSFDDQSPEYQQFLAQNQPRLTPAEVREINEIRVSNRVSEGTKTQIDALKDQRFADIEEPKIEQVATSTYNQQALLVTPKEILDAIAEETKLAGGDRAKGYAAASKYYKAELDVIHEVLTGVKADVREFERITRINQETGRPLVKVATDPKDPRYALHNRLAELVRAECSAFKDSAPQAEQVRNGKWFVAKDEWFQIDPSRRGAFWTFSNKEIMERALRRVPAYVQARIKAKQEELAGLGYNRPPRTRKEEATPPVKGAPPAPHPSQVPGLGGGGDTKTDGQKMAAAFAAAG